MNTKEKILEASLKLFNENGVCSVRLQQIADEIGISVGNLAYHFKSKDAIILSIYENLFEDFNRVLSYYIQSPNIEDFNDQIALYFNFFRKYQFYLCDIFSGDQSVHEIIENWQNCISKMHIQVRKRLSLYVKNGDLISSSEKTYDILAENLITTLMFWIPMQRIKKTEIDFMDFKNHFWFSLKPYFTEQGGNSLVKINNDNPLYPIY